MVGLKILGSGFKTADQKYLHVQYQSSVPKHFHKKEFVLNCTELRTVGSACHTAPLGDLLLLGRKTILELTFVGHDCYWI